MNKLWMCFIVLMVSGCSSIPLTSMVKMATLDPLTLEPESFRVAIRAPKDIDVENGAVKFELSYQSPGNTALEPVSRQHKFNVMIDKPVNASSEPSLFDDMEESDRVTVLSLSKQDAEQLKITQSLIAQHRDAEVEGATGMLRFNLDSACLKFDPSHSLEIDVLLKINSSEDYFVFLSRADVSQYSEKMNLTTPRVNKCDAQNG